MKLHTDVVAQTRRKARYCVDRLCDLEAQYYAVARRRSMVKPKVRRVIAPYTQFTGRRSFTILAGQFDKAVRIVKDLTRIRSLDVPMADYSDERYTGDNTYMFRS